MEDPGFNIQYHYTHSHLDFFCEHVMQMADFSSLPTFLPPSLPLREGLKNVAQTGFELTSLLAQFHECWDYRHDTTPSCKWRLWRLLPLFSAYYSVSESICLSSHHSGPVREWVRLRACYSKGCVYFLHCHKSQWVYSGRWRLWNELLFAGHPLLLLTWGHFYLAV